MARSSRDDDGSIAIFVVVSMIATMVIVATLTTVQSGLRTSRRSGDSANALQVADAGVNDAVKAIPTVPGTTFTRAGAVGSGSFQYTATRDPNKLSTWHIDAVGTDATGVKRHLRADASGQAVFASPMFINTSLNSQSGGTLDSYTSGASLLGPSGNYSDGGCTGNGVMFFSPGASVKFGSSGGGTSVVNCQQFRYGNSWNNVMDGCVVYGGGTTLPPTGSGACPASNTKSIPDDISPQTPQPPKDVSAIQSPVQLTSSPKPGNTFTCNASTGPTSLHAGWTYYYSTVNLQKGCGIDATTFNTLTPDSSWAANNVVTIYALNVNLDTGNNGGANAGAVNSPPTSTFPNICGGNVSTWSYSDVRGNPAAYYCSGWVKSLRINVYDSSGSVNITGNGGRFWGTFFAPSAQVTLNSANMEFWGAMVAGNLTVKNQFTWHYDDSLSDITTGKYTLTNWREEPL